ncbi:MAG TPA: hypothetical protein VK427_14030, partial [Kofleriaceae bacterium]|nr:hypothetical protein [Kofleriaceae bacterium]
MREILAKRALFAIVLAACGSQRAASDVDGGRGDALPGCYVAVEFDPPMPLAYPGSRVRATAQVTGANGVPTYTWHIHRASGAVVPFTSAAPDMSAVEFDSDVADVYEALVQVSGSSTGPCLVQPWMVNVAVPGANTTQVRLRVFPPTSIAAPPTERLALVSGGATSSIGTIAIDPGVVVTGTTGAHAYLRFMPAAAPDATVETFAAADGTFTARVLHQPHDVLIVPLVAGFAPRLVTGWLPGSNLPVEMGTEITG